jgi:SAM-dependent methyltransferase
VNKMNIIKRINNKIRREIKSAVGPKRFCNVCNTQFRGGFEPLSPKYEEQAKRTGYRYKFSDAETINYLEYSCPFCDSSDRDRLYALYLDRYLKAGVVYNTLDIAPAPALKNLLKMDSRIRYRSADLLMDDVDDKVDLMDMHVYKDEIFDIFICSHVLEHVRDDKKAMKELYRVLKPAGFGIMMVPIILSMEEIDEDINVADPDERSRRFGQEDHVRLYSKQGFMDRLNNVGFKIEEFTVTNFGIKSFLLRGISPKSVLYIVKK